MVSDCIGSPWLRGLEGPCQTFWWHYKMAGKNYFLFELFRRMYRETISYSYYSARMYSQPLSANNHTLGTTKVQYIVR